MPELTTVLTEADLRRGRATSQPDLTPYMDIIDTLREQGGVGGVLSLDEGENQRTVKRRMSIAAKDRGFQLTWRKAPEGQLRFVLAEPGQPTPGGRPRRARPEQQSEDELAELATIERAGEVVPETAGGEVVPDADVAVGMEVAQTEGRTRRRRQV
jgi:hypothetical protein